MTCHICRDTGTTPPKPHIAGITVTISACACEAGQRFVRETNATLRARQMNAELPEADRAMLKLKGMI